LLKLKPGDPDVLDLQTKLQKLLLLDNQVRDLMKAYGVPASGKAINPAKSPVAKYSGSAMSDAALADLDKLQKVIVPQYPREWLDAERNSCIKALADKMTMSAQ